MNRLTSLSNHDNLQGRVYKIKFRTDSWGGEDLEPAKKLALLSNIYQGNSQDHTDDLPRSGCNIFFDNLKQMLQRLYNLEEFEIQPMKWLMSHELSSTIKVDPAEFMTHLLQTVLGHHHLGAESVPIRRLAVKTCHRNLWGLELPLVEALRPGLKTLTVLDLKCIISGYYNSVQLSDINPHDGQYFNAASWHCFVLQAESLQQLRLTLQSVVHLREEPRHSNNIRATTTPISDVLRDIKWPNLMRLDLGDCLIIRDHFETFLIRYKSTLEYLSLTDCTIEFDNIGAWTTFFQFLQEDLQLIGSWVYGELLSSNKSGHVAFLDSESDLASQLHRFDHEDQEPLMLNRVVNYLVCGSKLNDMGKEDDVTKASYNWGLPDWPDIELGYASS